MNICYFVLLQNHYFLITNCYYIVTTLLFLDYCFIITLLLHFNIHYFELLRGHYYIITTYYCQITTHYWSWPPLHDAFVGETSLNDSKTFPKSFMNLYHNFPDLSSIFFEMRIFLKILLFCGVTIRFDSGLIQFSTLIITNDRLSEFELSILTF